MKICLNRMTDRPADQIKLILISNENLTPA